MSTAAATAARTAAMHADRAAFVAKVEALAAAGLTGHDLAAALGRRWKAVRFRLIEAGRTDLADRLAPPRFDIRAERAARLAHDAEARQALVEDVEWMLLGRETLPGAAARQAAVGGVGDTPQRLVDALAAAGRQDLIDRLRANGPAPSVFPRGRAAMTARAS